MKKLKRKGTLLLKHHSQGSNCRDLAGAKKWRV